MEQGIVVGTDQHQEWLLPWWWERYSQKNSYPVLFVDFGMSAQALGWCRERGELLAADKPASVAGEAQVEKGRRAIWEKLFGKPIWAKRGVWFKKPYVVAKVPFAEAIWCDLDCEIRGSLQPLFHCLNLGIEIALKPEPAMIQNLHRSLGLLHEGELNYNSGVIVFRTNGAIMKQWAEEAALRSELYPTDQEALSRALFTQRPRMLPLPDIYNWNPLFGDPKEALIVHYQGGFLKEELRGK